MKRILILIQSVCVLLLMFCHGSSMAGWKDVVDSAKNGVSGGVTQGVASQAVSSEGGVTQAGGLTDLLIKNTGVSQTQAEGGAGALFQLAKSRMQAEAFAKLEQAVPGMQGLLGAASALNQTSSLGGLTGGLSSVTGGSGGTAGNLVSLVSAFQQQGMSADMVQKFIPIVVDYVKNSAGSGLAGTLSSALTGL